MSFGQLGVLIIETVFWFLDSRLLLAAHFFVWISSPRWRRSRLCARPSNAQGQALVCVCLHGSCVLNCASLSMTIPPQLLKRDNIETWLCVLAAWDEFWTLFLTFKQLISQMNQCILLLAVSTSGWIVITWSFHQVKILTAVLWFIMKILVQLMRFPSASSLLIACLVLTGKC